MAGYKRRRDNYSREMVCFQLLQEDVTEDPKSVMDSWGLQHGIPWPRLEMVWSKSESMVTTPAILQVLMSLVIRITISRLQVTC